MNTQQKLGGSILLATIVLFSICVRGTAASDDQRSQMIEQLRQMSEEELRQSLDSLLQDPGFRWKEQFDFCLTEIVSRGPSWRPFLKSKLDELNEKSGGDPRQNRFARMEHNLELITAMHRIDGKPDPLIVEVEPFDSNELTPIALPRITVSLKNQSEQPINVALGGNYRSGRLTRWRAQLSNSDGHVIAVKPWPIAMGGGLMSGRELAPGETINTELILDHMLDSPPPGKYQLQLLYHNIQPILMVESLNGLLLFKSEPIAVEVKPIEIKLNETIISDARQYIGQLETDQPVRVLIGEYGQWVEDFISKESALGKLLQMRLAAVPSIIEALNDAGASPLRRAHLLAALFSITNHNDPRVTSAIGSYKYLSDGWSVGGSSFHQSSGTRHRGSIKTEDQQVLMERWNHWLKTSVKITYE